MRKSSLSSDQMSSVAFVERAARLSRDLTRMRARGPGDLENAMRAIERDYGIDYWIIWRLRYRVSQIRDIGAAVLARIEAAYQAECERQHKRLAHEIEITRKVCGTDCAVVVAAARVLGAEETGPGDAQDVEEDFSD